MALELYETALNEICDIRTSLYDLFFELIEEKKPISQISEIQSQTQSLRSTPRSNRTKPEKTKQDIILIEESEEDDSTNQSRTEFSIGTDSIHKKNYGSADKNITPIRVKDTAYQKNLSTLTKINSVLKPGKRLIHTISPRKGIEKKKSITKLDIRLTRSKAAPRRSQRKTEGVSTSNKK